MQNLLQPMSIVIVPPKAVRQPDPWLSPVPGSWGPCALCGYNSRLTEAHIPPRSVGNAKRWLAQSYMVTVAANDKDRYFPRHFRRGLCFKTLCRDCNSGLGGREDIALADFFGRVRKLVESPLDLGPLVRIPAKPNLIYRAVLAHVVSANDTGMPSDFDAEARELFFKKRDLRQTSWSLFYWLYLGDELLLMRNVFDFKWYPVTQLRIMHLLKLFPLGFMLTQDREFLGLPNAKQFLCSRDDEEVELPLYLSRWEASPVWPAQSTKRNIVLLGGNSFGLVGSRG